MVIPLKKKEELGYREQLKKCAIILHMLHVCISAKAMDCLDSHNTMQLSTLGSDILAI